MLAKALQIAPDFTDAIFNIALLLQRKNEYAEAADYWRRYLANDSQSEWAGRARRSLKFCEMQVHLIASLDWLRVRDWPCDCPLDCFKSMDAAPTQ